MMQTCRARGAAAGDYTVRNFVGVIEDTGIFMVFMEAFREPRG